MVKKEGRKKARKEGGREKERPEILHLQCHHAFNIGF